MNTAQEQEGNISGCLVYKYAIAKRIVKGK